MIIYTNLILTNSIFNRFHSIFDEVVLPKAPSLDVYTTSSNDLTSNGRVNITNWHKAYPTSKEITHI